MLPEDAPGEGFTIRDRRRQDAGPDPVPPSERTPSVRPEPGVPPSKTRDGPPPDATGAPPEPDLAALFLLLANSALFYLGEGPEPSGEAAPVDLAQAQFSIELLRLLREKTDGHRTPEENRLLDGILYDLELRFVQVVRSR